MIDTDIDTTAPSVSSINNTEPLTTTAEEDLDSLVKEMEDFSELVAIGTDVNNGGIICTKD